MRKKKRELKELRELKEPRPLVPLATQKEELLLKMRNEQPDGASHTTKCLNIQHNILHCHEKSSFELTINGIACMSFVIVSG